MCLAIPGKIISVQGEELNRTGRVDFSGVIKDVNLSFVPEALLGDYVIVHVGFAISKVDQEAAAQVFEYLKEIDELNELKGTS